MLCAMRSMHTPEYKQFLVLLVAARRARGFTQKDVAKALRIPQSRLSRMETGERRVDVIELAAFARLYRRRITYFLP